MATTRGQRCFQCSRYKRVYTEIDWHMVRAEGAGRYRILMNRDARLRTDKVMCGICASAVGLSKRTPITAVGGSRG